MTDLQLPYELPAHTKAGKARMGALAAAAGHEAQPTTRISYQSRGLVLIIGPEASAKAMVDSLDSGLHCAVLAIDESAAPRPSSASAITTKETEEGHTVSVVHAELAGLAGHLGAFVVTVSLDGQTVNLATSLGIEPAHFDVVLDLGAQPTFRTERLPPGYFVPERDEAALSGLVEEVNGLVGEFEKPQYIQYNPDICAHGERGLTGCTRCIDVCPAGAITSIGERIAADAHLCHGLGSCASVCPTGAITYAYPSLPDNLDRIRMVIRAYREQAGEPPQLLFHDAELGRRQVAQAASVMPEGVIPIELEEVGSVGMDTCLAAVAYGAATVSALVTEATPESVAQGLEMQLKLAQAVLSGLGFQGATVRRLQLADGQELSDLFDPDPIDHGLEPARFAGMDEKKTMLRLILGHLYEQASEPAAEVALFSGAPFGEILVDKQACTLCMACVAVCPAKALSHGAESPQLNFTEWNCVQCGLCETACPEDAITRAPRLVLDPARRRHSRVLNEEPPFACIDCGKPFAPRGVIDKMLEKLKDHRMFQGDAIKRLQKCEDCRIKDMF